MTPAGSLPALPPDRAVAILEGIGEAMIVLDRDYRVTWWNAAAERATGVLKKDVLGERLFHRFPRLEGTAAERALEEVAERREPRSYTGWHFSAASSGTRASDTRPGIYDARLWPLDDGGLLVLCTEVTAREMQRRELEERNRENVELRDFARAMAAMGDAGDLLRLLCTAAMKHLGGTSSIVARDLRNGTGECIAAAGTGHALEGTRFPLEGSLIGRVVATGRPVVLADYASESPYFTEVAADEQLGPIVMTPLVAHGELLGVFGLARRRGRSPFTDADLERLGVFVDHASLAAWKARLVERAESANEAKAAFLASMSHELRTPLTALTGYGELLADEILGPLGKAQMEMVERMRTVTHNLSALVDELMTYSSLEAGKEYARIAPVALRDVVDEALVVVEPLARLKGLDFSVSGIAGLPIVLTDGDKVRQVLVNLLGNAIKFTDRGSVRLDVCCTEHTMRFRVRDTGIGIAPEDHARLFQPFGQLDI
ncbi:MAG TPA: GAF domain-containing protein, partial [Gemmatimonadaceae bacterium]|nr:GAF domain-containing protein [Gemmatimonadaceae bacterium]